VKTTESAINGIGNKHRNDLSDHIHGMDKNSTAKAIFFNTGMLITFKNFG
jgi:hypothetical protein